MATAELLYLHVCKQNQTHEQGHWFFHTGHWTLSAEMFRTGSRRWGLAIRFVPIGKEKPPDSLTFPSATAAKAYLSDFFGAPIRQVSPHEMPSPEGL